MDRRKWLEWRKCSIGGSDVPKLFGLYGGPEEVILSKLDGDLDGEPSPAMARGSALEDWIAAAFEMATGQEIVEREALQRHPLFEEGFCAHASVDGKLRDGSNYEAKSARCSSRAGSAARTGQIFFSYALQLAHYAAVTGREDGFLAVLVGPDHDRAEEWRGSSVELIVFKYKVPLLISGALMEFERRWWRKYIKGAPGVPVTAPAHVRDFLQSRLWFERVAEEDLVAQSWRSAKSILDDQGDNPDRGFDRLVDGVADWYKVPYIVDSMLALCQNLPAGASSDQHP